MKRALSYLAVFAVVAGLLGVGLAYWLRIGPFVATRQLDAGTELGAAILGGVLVALALLSIEVARRRGTGVENSSSVWD
jgi:hypothetical protein